MLGLLVSFLPFAVHQPPMRLNLSDIPLWSLPIPSWNRKKQNAEEYHSQKSDEILLLTVESRYGVSANLSPKEFRDHFLMHPLAYIYADFKLKFYNYLYYKIPTNISLLLCFFEWCSWSSEHKQDPGTKGMEKEKGKAPLGGLLISRNSVLNQNKMKSEMSKNIPTNTKSLPIPNPMPLSSGPQTKIKIKRGGSSTPHCDLSAMFQKLPAARENGKKKKEPTLVGFLVGEQKEFPRLFAKLRMEWKPLKGAMTFTILKAGWFEISFSNQADFLLIWANRPYHMFSQILLLKQWYPGFDPTSESISQLDLWVRLHYLPEEFANSDALETIIEGNQIGKFLKMVPTHNSERWNMFTRFCINIDVEKTFGKGVIVPDEHFNKIKFSLWFDDFSPGCGACGKHAHVYKDCPNKNAPTPTLQNKLKKPSTKLAMESGMDHGEPSQSDWNLVGKNNKASKPTPSLFLPSNNIYLSEKGGINVIYESDESDEAIQHILMEEEILEKSPNLIVVSDDLYPFNTTVRTKEMAGLAPGVGTNPNLTTGPLSKIPQQSMVENAMKTKESTEVDDTPILRDNINANRNLANPGEHKSGKDILIEPLEGLNKGENGSTSMMASLKGKEIKSKEMTAEQMSNGNCGEAIQNPNFQEEMEEFDEEQFEYEYDDLLVDEPLDQDNTTLPMLTMTEAEMKPILISDDPPFSERDLEEFINNEQMGKEATPAASEGSFHSLLNSIHSSSSFAVQLGRLAVNHAENSTSNSSKRKCSDGTDDTTSSGANEGKKPRK